jgi:hypothetical protein
VRIRVACLLLALLPAIATADESPVHISGVRTKDLNLYYFDSLSYLEPHAVRTFTNSLAWQRRVFGWAPSEPTIVLLQDFTDYGNAHTYSAPRSILLFDTAPLSLAFETYPASERMYSLMNHELIHVVQSDIASEEDLRWRRFFLGKVDAQSMNPESIVYSYLTTPRYTTPRWWAEGGAVFFETWMGGGLGRAQGGYDEMVFRAMVRDDAHFYDALGLQSRGVFVDFQTGTSIRRRRSSTGTGATSKANATTRTSSSVYLAYRLIRPGRTGSNSSMSSRTRTSPRFASIRSRLTRTWQGR